MTTLQKAFIATTFVVAAGTGFFEAHKASTAETRIQALLKQQAPLAEQIQQLQNESERATRQLKALRADNERLNGNASELVKLRNEVVFLRGVQPTRERTAISEPPQTEIIGTNGVSSDEMGRILGTAVVHGEHGAFGRLSELAETEHLSFSTNNIGLNDTQRDALSRQLFSPLHAAFKVIQEAAVGGNEAAADAMVQALQIPELKGGAVKCIGALAGNGNDTALEILLNPRKYDLLASGVVGALQPAADHGNQRAIDFLATVARDAGQSALWYMAALGLEKSAVSGNEVAIEALIGMSASTNINLQNAVIPGLRAASANQNAKAAEALRSMGIE